jgi:beta-glucanase (GH16 family)
MLHRRNLLLASCASAIAGGPAFGRPTLDLSSYEQTFSTDFSKPSQALLKRNGGPFTTRFEEWGGLRTLPGNKELQLYVDPDFVPAPEGTDKLGRADARTGSGIAALGVNPFSIRQGILEITAIPTPASMRGRVDRPFLSGLLCTEWSFAQRYGYFEMRARLPGGRGLWPAFWLVAKTHREHIEIDTMEAVGWDTHHVYQSTHLKESRGKGIHVKVGPPGFDYTDGMHSYGVAWTPDDLVFFIDGVETTRTSGAPFRDSPPMYMLANLAVGGDWAGTPDDGTQFPAVMQIAHIRAYALK